MNIKTLALCLLPGLMIGCATAPTPQQEAIAASGIRITTVAYITRGKTVEEQATRAKQVLAVTAIVRSYVSEQGDMVFDLDAAAAAVNAKIMASTLAPGDKALAQALVTEAMFLAGDPQVVPHPAIGSENAARLLQIVGEIDRVARVFAQ
jgi:hypothetical protein